MIVSVASGVCVGTHMARQLGMMHKSTVEPPYVLGDIDTAWCGLIFVRLVIGVVLLVITRQVMKTVALKVVALVTKIDTKVKENQQKLCVELPCKFLTYFSIAMVNCLVVPIVFKLLNIHRESYFYEL